jgi:histidinol dehydrogenase
MVPAGQRAMPIRLDSRSADFPARFATFLATKREASPDVEQAVRAIIAECARTATARWSSSARKAASI